MNEFLIALGGNMPDGTLESREVLEAALREFALKRLMIRARSRFYRTPAFPEGSGPDFVNAAIKVEASSNVASTLAMLHEIEERHGRVRTQRWAARTLDLDLLAAGQSVCPDPETHRYWRDLPLEAQQATAPDRLILPHPRLQERAFVLVPLLEVAPDWRHPLLGKTVRQMHDALPRAARDAVKPL